MPSRSQCIISENVYLFIPQIPERKQLSIPKIESPEGYYEEAEPYDASLNGTPWARAGAWRGQPLLAQMPVLDTDGGLGCPFQRVWLELRTGRRALALCSVES